MNILRTKDVATRCIYRNVRHKVTLNKVEASKSSDVQRPTPILLLRTSEESSK